MTIHAGYRELAVFDPVQQFLHASL